MIPSVWNICLPHRKTNSDWDVNGKDDDPGCDSCCGGDRLVRRAQNTANPAQWANVKKETSNSCHDDRKTVVIATTATITTEQQCMHIEYVSVNVINDFFA